MRIGRRGHSTAMVEHRYPALNFEAGRSLRQRRDRTSSACASMPAHKPRATASVSSSARRSILAGSESRRHRLRPGSRQPDAEFDEACATTGSRASEWRGQEPRVRVFVMGANKWRTSDEWPIEAPVSSCYLNGKGAANTASGDGTLSPTKPSAAGTPDRFKPIPARRFKRWRTVSAGCGAGAARPAPGAVAGRCARLRTPPLTNDVESQDRST
jgi:hypothetical protein